MTTSRRCIWDTKALRCCRDSESFESTLMCVCVCGCSVPVRAVRRRRSNVSRCLHVTKLPWHLRVQHQLHLVHVYGRRRRTGSTHLHWLRHGTVNHQQVGNFSSSHCHTVCANDHLQFYRNGERLIWTPTKWSKPFKLWTKPGIIHCIMIYVSL